MIRSLAVFICSQATVRAMPPESEIDRLYGLPLAEFTPARDELAARLRREGDADGAAEVKRLRKPSVAAWALNQVSRTNPKGVKELIETGRRLRQAQEGLLAGGRRDPLDKASEKERRLVAELSRHAERELVAAGRSVSGSVQEKLRGTLHAVATDSEARDSLRSGRLVREHAASGLGPLVEVPEREIPRRARRLEEQLEQARSEQRELEEELSAARRALRVARREAARASSALERAEAADEQAQARAEKAGERTAQLEAELRRA